MAVESDRRGGDGLMEMWHWIALVMSVVYGTGFVLFMLAHAQMPVTLGLAFLRSALWPIYWFTGWPSGRPLPMD